MAQADAQAPLVSEFADDADMLELVEMFVSELPERVSALQNALKAQDIANLARTAHQLKGAAGGYGFPTITDAAAELEKCAKAADQIDKLAQEVKNVADLCTRARAK